VTSRTLRLLRSGIWQPFAAMSLALLSSLAAATDFSLDRSLHLDANHDDNLLLREQPLSSLGQTANARMGFGAASEQTSADVEVELWARRFNRSDFNSDDQRVRANFSHTFELSSIGLRLDALRDSTLTSEPLDSGRIEDAQRHEQYSASPNWSYQLGEQDLLSLQGSYVSSYYRGQGYSDYRYWQAQLLWTHSITERLRGFVAVNYSDYQSQPRLYAFSQSYATGSTEHGLQIGGDYQFSENIVASILAGSSANETEAQVEDPLQYCPFAEAFDLLPLFPLCTLQDSDSSLTTVNASLKWSNPRHELTADISHNTQPSSNGFVQEVAQLDLNWRYRVWEYGTLGLALIAGAADVSGEQATGTSQPSRDYQYATLSYSHALNESWFIDCNYRYRSQQYENRDQVTSDAAFVGITWKPKSQHWSR